MKINKTELIEEKLKKRIPGKWLGYYFAEGSKLLVMRCSKRDF